jgi:hypothetical protein
MFLALMSAPALAADTPADRYARYALNNARLLGLTPEGTALWAEHIQRTGDWLEWRRVTEIEAEIGRQLARVEVDWRLLDQLASDYASESARAVRVRKQRTVDTALQLTAKDRKAIGAFLEQTSRRRTGSSTLPPNLPQAASDAATGFFRSFGLSAEGTELLIQAARQQEASTSTRIILEGVVGEQLSRDQPDSRILDNVVAKFAAEEGRLARSEKKRLIQVAKQLRPADRQRFGRVLRDAAAEGLNDMKPVLEIVP